MNDEEVHSAIAKGDPLFFWLHLTNGEQFLIPYIFQLCGNCCRLAFEVPCVYFEEPNICNIYTNRPPSCKHFPISAYHTISINCPGFELSLKAIKKLGQDSEYAVGHNHDYFFKSAADIHEAINKLEKEKLPEDFVGRFLEFNSQ